MDRITVKAFYTKLFDLCNIRKCMKRQRALYSKIKKIILHICPCLKKKKVKWPRPKSLEKVPESSDSEPDDELDEDDNKKI